ncbi:MAG: hypothetical protein ABI627_15745 [Polyangiaceae bacterium]
MKPIIGATLAAAGVVLAGAFGCGNSDGAGTSGAGGATQSTAGSGVGGAKAGAPGGSTAGGAGTSLGGSSAAGMSSIGGGVGGSHAGSGDASGGVSGGVSGGAGSTGGGNPYSGPGALCAGDVHCAVGAFCCEDTIGDSGCIANAASCGCATPGHCIVLGCDEPSDCKTGVCCATRTQSGTPVDEFSSVLCKSACDPGDLPACTTQADCLTGYCQPSSRAGFFACYP